MAMLVTRAALRAQVRCCHRTRAAQMRDLGMDATVAFHEERKALIQEEYAYPDSREERDPKFDARLETFAEIYEGQEMDGTCRYLMQKELDQAEQKIYDMAVRTGNMIRKEFQVVIHQRIEEAKARLIRRYKGLDADLRSGDDILVSRAQAYLDRVGSTATEHRWDYARAAHKRLGAELQGTPQQQERLKAENEMDGLPDATADILRTFKTSGFLEREEFAMLRREVGEEVADEFVTKLQKTRAEVTQKRIKALSDRTRLNQLEKQLVLQEYKQVFDQHYKYEHRAKGAERLQEEAEVAEEDIEAFVRERDLSGEEGLNNATHGMSAEVRRKRMEILKERRRGQEPPDFTPQHWDATTGLVQNPRNFVDSDWWELATDNPGTKRSYATALRRDIRAMRRDVDAVSARQHTADDVLGAMERFNDFRKDRHYTGYSKSQVLAYNDDFTNEPRNSHIEQVFGKQMLRPEDKYDQATVGFGKVSTAGKDATWQRWLTDAEKMAPPGRHSTRLPGA